MEKKKVTITFPGGDAFEFATRLEPKTYRNNAYAAANAEQRKGKPRQFAVKLLETPREDVSWAFDGVEFIPPKRGKAVEE